MNSPIVAIVTGANRGIGEAICQVLARTSQEPIILYAASRQGQDLGLTPASSKTTLRYPKLDIADRGSIDSLAKTIQKEHEKFDVLINNAGANLDLDYSPTNVKATLDTNYRGTLNESVNNGNESRDGWKSQAYGVTKAATNAMTAVLARENPGLTINACCPGWVYVSPPNRGREK
ncbi:MAG: hypothetical protein Q9226_002963 [Calogaya cf. arnoldii]